MIKSLRGRDKNTLCVADVLAKEISATLSHGSGSLTHALHADRRRPDLVAVSAAMPFDLALLPMQLRPAIARRGLGAMSMPKSCDFNAMYFGLRGFTMPTPPQL
jgi:hypothetical protein